jgi:hypothetical protein
MEASVPTVHELLLQAGYSDGINGGIDLAIPETQAFIRGLPAQVPETDGKPTITNADAEAIIALAERTRTWAQVDGIAPLRPGHVTRALFIDRLALRIRRVDGYRTADAETIRTAVEGDYADAMTSRLLAHDRNLMRAIEKARAA